MYNKERNKLQEQLDKQGEEVEAAKEVYDKLDRAWAVKKPDFDMLVARMKGTELDKK